MLILGRSAIGVEGSSESLRLSTRIVTSIASTAVSIWRSLTLYSGAPRNIRRAVTARRQCDLVGNETDRGPLVRAPLAAGYQVYSVNPLAVSRCRDRHATSRAKSDAGDAKLLADLVRTDRHNHRPIAGDSELAGAIQVLARAHQNLVLSRQRQVNQLRNTLREFYPGALVAFGTDLAGGGCGHILERAPTPSQGRSISQAKTVSALRNAGR